jgi:hypothetical protein
MSKPTLRTSGTRRLGHPESLLRMDRMWRGTRGQGAANRPQMMAAAPRHQRVTLTQRRREEINYSILALIGLSRLSLFLARSSDLSTSFFGT